METIYFTLIIGTIIQWIIVITNLLEKEYSTKIEFLIKMIPGYFIIVLIRGCWNIFNHFMLLK